MIKRVLKTKPVHLVAFPVLFISHHFFALVFTLDANTPSSIIEMAFVILASLAICSLPLALIYSLVSRKWNPVKTSIIISILFIPFFFFQNIYILLSAISSENIRIRWFILIVPLTFIAISIAIILSRKKFTLLQEYLNMTSILLVLYILLNLGLFFSELKPVRLKYNPPIENLKCDNCPDIFFLILDSYTSNHSLRSYFAFDNTDFSSRLENLGFKVSDQSLSSYSKTAYSIASTFTLGRIDGLDKYFENDMVELIKKNTVAKSLTEKGYLIYNYSLFDILEESKYYSVSLELTPGFVDVIYQNTILKWFVDNVNQYTNMYSIHNEILYQMVEKSKTAHSQPIFLYAHIMAPHAPFVIDTAGKEVTFANQKTVLSEAYLAQVEGLNIKVYDAVSQVRENLPNAIVIIQGDHGSRLFKKEIGEIESHTVFSATYLPQKQFDEFTSNSNKIFGTLFQSINSK